jgi:type II secretory pathway predicted ATPase ExeA
MNRDRVFPDDAVEAAIARVLDAEHSARDAVRDAGAAAAAMIEAARAAARTLAERTERRIGAVRARYEQKTTAEVVALDAEAAEVGAPHELTPDDLARLDAAVAELAARLTEGATR